MKDTRGVGKREQDREPDWSRERSGQEKGGAHSSARVNKGALMAALAQGAVPHLQGQEMLESLSRLGNYAFLQAWERREGQVQGLAKYAEKERFSAENLRTLLNEVTREFHPQEGVNTLTLMPPLPHFLHDAIPGDWLIDDMDSVSQLVPIPFEQCFSGSGTQEERGGTDGAGEQ